MTIRRLKTYAGTQGYVYQYYFVGKRAAAGNIESPNPPTAFEYIFDVTSDRKLTYAVRIIFPVCVAAAWADGHGRALSDSEQYAAIKMRLFRAFDETEEMQAHGRELQLDLPFLEESLTALGVD
jgi:hypothetical protein